MYYSPVLVVKQFDPAWIWSLFRRSGIEICTIKPAVPSGSFCGVL